MNNWPGDVLLGLTTEGHKLSRIFRTGSLAALIAATAWLWGTAPAAAQTVSLELLSKAPPGSTPAGGSGSPSSSALSADGRYVLFHSAGPNLVEGQADDNGTYDVFLLDRRSGVSSLVSRRAGFATATAGGYSYGSALSRNGRFALFSSTAADLVAGQVDPTPSSDLFVFDATSGAVRLVSHIPSSATTTAGTWSSATAVSDNGWVLFQSESQAFFAGDSEYTDDVFLFDPGTGSVRLVSHLPGQPAARPAYGDSTPQALSADGRWVLYSSFGQGMDADVAASAPYAAQVYLYDRDTDTSRMVSRAIDGTAGNAYSEAVAMTPDGAYVLFNSDATNLATVFDDNETTDAFVFERDTGMVHPLSLSRDAPGTMESGRTLAVGLSDDGRRVLLRRPLEEIWTHPPREVADGEAYVVDRRTGERIVATNHNDDPARRVEALNTLSISVDGRFVLFSAFDMPESGIADDNRELDVFRFDVESRRSTLVSRPDGTARTASGPTHRAQLSADGSALLLHSGAVDLVPGLADANGYVDVFVRDAAGGATALCARASGEVASTVHSYYQASGGMSADGSEVLITGYGLVPGYYDAAWGGSDVFHLNRRTGGVTLLSPRPLWFQSGWSTWGRALAGGVALLSSSVPRFGDVQAEGNSDSDVFVFELMQPESGPRLVSRSTAAAGRTANGRSIPRALSPSGRHILFDSMASDLVPGVIDTNLSSDVFVFDRASGTMDLVSSVAGQPSVASGNAESVAFSDDGRWVLVEATTNAMVAAGGPQGSRNVYLVDREADVVQLVSHVHDESVVAADGFSDAVALTPDGRWTLYASTGSNLVPLQVDGNGNMDVFVFDREAGASALVSHAADMPATAGNRSSSATAISQDGRYVLYDSEATNLLVVEDRNDLPDVFLFDRLVSSSQLVSARGGGAPASTADHRSHGVAMSADGQRVLFRSRARNLIPGVSDMSAGYDLFAYDAGTRRTALVSRSRHSARATANGESYGVSMTSDGTGILFGSEATDLVEVIDVNRSSEVYYASVNYEGLFAAGFEGR